MESSWICWQHCIDSIHLIPLLVCLIHFLVSQGDPYPRQEQNAIDVVVQFALHRLNFPAERIILYGWSIGGFTGSSATQLPITNDRFILYLLINEILIIILLFPSCCLIHSDSSATELRISNDRFILHLLINELLIIILLFPSRCLIAASWAAMNYPNIRAVMLDATFDHVLPLALNVMPASWKSLVVATVHHHLNLAVAEQLVHYPGPVVLFRRTRDEVIALEYNLKSPRHFHQINAIIHPFFKIIYLPHNSIYFISI